MELYHGSPYKFDSFDLAKVGTGAEINRYGYGFYFSDSALEAIKHAKENTLSKKGIYLYTVKILYSYNIVELDGECEKIDAIANILRKMGEGDSASELQDEYRNYGMTNKQTYDYLVAVFDSKIASKIFNEVDIVGFKMQNTGWYEGEVYLIFSPSNIRILNIEKM